MPALRAAETIESLLIALAVIAGGALGLALYIAFDRSRRARVRRLAGLVARAAPHSENAVEAIRLARAPRETGFVVGLLPRRAKLESRLRRAGYRAEAMRYAAAVALTALVAGGLLAMAGLGWPICVLGGVGVGLLLPHLFLSNRIGARETRFIGNLPEGIDIIVRGLKAGLPVSESLAAVGREGPEPVGGVFREVVDQVRIGRSVEDAIERVAHGMAVPELRFLGITLAIQKETGGNLTETLENLSEILRRRRQMKLKIRAVSSEARASAYIIGALPFAVSLAIYIVNRDYVMTLFTDPRGIVMTGVGLLSISLGAVAMMRLVRFDI